MKPANKIILVVMILLGLTTTTLAQTDAEVITPDNAGQLQLVYELDVPDLVYGNVRLSSDGSLLAASTDTKVTIWDLANQSSIGSYPVSYENELVGFTPDNQYFVYTDEGTIYLWDVDLGDLYPFDLADGTEHITIDDIAISPDGQFVAAISGIWGAASPVEISLISVNDLTITGETVEYGFTLAFSADDSLLVTTGSQTDLLVWSLMDNSLKLDRTLVIDTSNSFGFTDPIFTCEGLNIVVDNVTSDWVIDLATDETKQLMAGIRGFDDRTCGDVFLFTSNNIDRVFVDVLTGESLFIWDNPEEFGRLLAISPDGSIAVMELGDGFVLWDTRTGSKIFSLDFLEIENADFSLDGRFLVVWDYGRLIQVWAVFSE